MVRLTVIALFAVTATAHGGLFEVTVTGTISDIHYGNVVPVPTANRVGMPAEASFAFNTARLDDSFVLGSQIRYATNEPFRFQSGSYDIANRVNMTSYSDDHWVVRSLDILTEDRIPSGLAGKYYPVYETVAAFFGGQQLDFPPAAFPTPIVSDSVSVQFERAAKERPGGYPAIFEMTTDAITGTLYFDGDTNKDFMFDQLDLVQVLAAGKYNTGEAALWSQGDWTGDGLFSQLDIIAALPNYNFAPSTAMVPEPASIMLLVLGVLLLPFRLTTHAGHTLRGS